MNLLMATILIYMIQGWGDFVGATVRPISILHTAGAFLIVVFLIGHLYLATTGKSIYSHFMMMINGYHEHDV